MVTPKDLRHLTQLLKRGAALNSLGKTLPLVPMKVSIPKVAAHSRVA